MEFLCIFGGRVFQVGGEIFPSNFKFKFKGIGTYGFLG
jgi:hypothetical protein